MATSTLIEDFLIALSFKLDTASQKRFTDAVEGASKRVTNFAGIAGKAITGLELGTLASVAGITAGIESVAQKYESMYYLARNSGSSIEGVNKFAYAISQLGGTAEGAKSSLAAFGSFLRSAPGAETYIRRLGVATRTSTGQSRDTAEVYNDTLRRISQMPAYLGQQYASLIGTDQQTLLTFRGGNVQKYEEELEHYYRMFGFDTKKAGEIAVEFEQTQRRTSAVASVLYEEAATAIEKWLLSTAAPAVQRGLADIEGYWVKHRDTINTIIDFITTTSFAKWEADFAKLAPGTEAALQPLLTFFHNDFLKAWEDVKAGFSESITELETDFANVAPNVMGVLKPLTDYFKGDWRKDLTGFATDLGSLEKFLNDASGGHWAAAGKDLAAIYHNDTDGRTDITKGVLNNATGGWYGQSVDSLSAQLTGGKLGQKMVDRQDLGISFLETLGVPKAAAIGLVANGTKESTLGLNPASWTGAHRGVFQWDAGRRQKILDGFGIDVWNDHNYHDQLKAAAWELRHGESGAYSTFVNQADPTVAAQLISRNYERTDHPDFEAAVRSNIASDIGSRYGFGPARGANGAPVVTSNTNITVHGSGDPHATAAAVAQKQVKVQTDVIRNALPSSW